MEFRPLILKDGRKQLLKDDETLIFKQFDFYKIKAGQSVLIPDGQVMKAPFLILEGSLIVEGALRLE